MRGLTEAKKKYDSIPIPEELSERILGEIKKAEERRLQGGSGTAAEEERELPARRRLRVSVFRKGAAAVAAAAVAFTVLLNTNTALAAAAGQIPFLGPVARVLTFRSYEQESEDVKIAVEIPEIQMIAADTGAGEAVNREILSLCEQYADEARQRALEYRQAFLDTGGTQEEWAAHAIEIRVWYEIKSNTSRYLSLAVEGTESWTSAYSQVRYYSFDQETGERLTLDEILGEQGRQAADENIRSQMREREAQGAEYWEENFAGIGSDTAFYMNEAGNLVIVFEKYEIAPGSEGRPEFEIAV